MNQHHDAIISLVASLAPDRGVPVGRHTELVDDLGYDSPRKMELVASIEKHLQIAVPPPQHPIDTVDDLLRWIDTISTPRQATHEPAYRGTNTEGSAAGGIGEVPLQRLNGRVVHH